jgi:hypothetical protein
MLAEPPNIAHSLMWQGHGRCWARLQTLTEVHSQPHTLQACIKRKDAKQAMYIKRKIVARSHNIYTPSTVLIV